MVVGLMLLAACATGTSAPSRFYVLAPLEAPEAEPQLAPGERCLAIGIGPVEIPAYLDRPQIVTRLSNNELNLAEFDKWAEPLRDNLIRVLAENISSLLCTEPITISLGKAIHASITRWPSTLLSWMENSEASRL
jgi:hypothetical protein